MKKTTLYLEPQVDRDLTRMAGQLGVSKAELIREALRRMVEGMGRPEVKAIGVGKGPGDVAADIDRHLEETGFGDR